MKQVRTKKVTAKKVVKRIPATENGPGTEYTARSGNKYLITKNVNKPLFYLWRKTKDGYEKLCQMESPYDMYVLIDHLEGVDREEVGR